MPRKINRLLILLLFTALLIFGVGSISAGGKPTHLLYFPIISDDISKWIGPDGGYIVVTAFDPSDPQVEYAGTWGSGIYKSLDGGQSWQSSNPGLSNFYINSLAVDPIQPSILYAGTYKSQVYKSIDRGQSWVWSGVGMQDQAIVYTIAIDPVVPSTLYAGTRGVSNNGDAPWKGVIYKSEDGGQTWNAVLADVGGVDDQDWAYQLVVNPEAHYAVYAAFHEHGPYRSLDYGNSWARIREGVEDLSGRSILIDPATVPPSTLYYGVWRYDAVYKSMNGGDSWQLSNNGLYFTHVFSMVIDRYNPDTLYLATFNQGVLKTKDGGDSWHISGLQGDKIYSLAINPGSSTSLLAGTYGDGIYRSNDAGASWQRSNTGIENTDPTSIIISPTNPQRIYASIYGAGVYQSPQQVIAWEEMNTGLRDKFVHTLVQNPSQPTLVYALTDTAGLFRNDLTTSTGWESYGEGLPLTSLYAPAYSMDHPFATYEMQEYQLDPALAQEVNQPTAVNLLTMVFAPSVPQTVYLGTRGAGVLRSTNEGLNWQPAGLDGETILSLAVDPVQAGLIYASTEISGSISISQDGGATWTKATLPVTFYSLATAATSPDSLLAGTSDGVYRYQAGSWTQLGLPGQAVTSITPSKTQPGLIYAGTTAGAYYTLDGGIHWKPVSDSISNLTVQSITIDPTHPNWVYICTTTHGIYFATIRF